jgi:hypothetical protein
MLQRIKLICVAATAALLVFSIACATAATAHPNKKMIHASRQVPKSAATRPSASPAQQPSSNY